MIWTVSKAEIWLSSVDIAWTREFEGLTQRLNVVSCNDGTMHLYASQWFIGDEIVSFKLDNVTRRFVIDQSEITNLWNLAYFGGESV
jgi:hypothetical protein